MSQPYNVKNFSREENIGYLLKRVGTQLRIAFDRALAEYDMTHAQIGIFFRLLHGSAQTAAELARETMTDTGSMTRMLDRLEEKGFVQRTRSHEDRRVVQVELTAKGKQLGDQMTQVVIDGLNHHLRGFSAAEIAQFKDFLRRMLANA
jgi:DNA-binding MarR family transcriptional regulator